MTEVFTELKKPFPVDKVDFRIGSRTQDKSKGIGLAYITARDVMERLDEAVGPDCWQDRYEFHGTRTVCYLSLYVGGFWLTKADGAGDSDVEAEKGAISDALKRAAVKWGIGRYLYDMPNVWVPLINDGKKFAPESEKMLRTALAKLTAGEKPVIPETKDKANIKFVSEINQLQTPNLAQRWAEDNKPHIECLPVDQQEEVCGEWEKKFKRLEEGDTKPGSFKFEGTEASRAWVVDFKKDVDRAGTPIALSNLVTLNKPKLDAVLGQKDGKTDKQELREYVEAKRNSFNLTQAG